MPRVSVCDLTWRPRWAAPPSGPHPERGYGSEISWEPRPAPCSGSPFHLPHSWYTRGQTEAEKWNANMAHNSFLCASPILLYLTVLSWPRVYHGGYLSVCKRGCYKGFLVIFVPRVILITWRILMSWVWGKFLCHACHSFSFSFIKLSIAIAPMFLVHTVFLHC